jgi:hypothetical protein
VREIRSEYVRINRAYFKGRLEPAVLDLQDTERTLGRFVPATRTIELSRPQILTLGWLRFVEVLKHEMAHQYVFEVLGVTDETAHGRTFQEVTARLGIDGAAQGTPEPRQASDDATRIMDRISKLLALAGSDNSNEAEAAMAAAQRLLWKHNVDFASANASRGYVHRALGEPKGRIYEPERLLASILTRFFFVEAIWIPAYRPREALSGSVLEICGTASNVEIASYVHGFLLGTAERLWVAHKRGTGVRSDRERRTFLAGVMTGMLDKLSRDKASALTQGLVWVKDGDLADFFRRRHPYVRHVRYAGQQKSEAYAKGREAGRRIVIHKGMKAAESVRGLQLPPKRGS